MTIVRLIAIKYLYQLTALIYIYIFIYKESYFILFIYFLKTGDIYIDRF